MRVVRGAFVLAVAVFGQCLLSRDFLRHKIHAHMGRVTSCSPIIKRPLVTGILQPNAVLMTSFSVCFNSIKRLPETEVCVPLHRNDAIERLALQSQEVPLGHKQCCFHLERGWRKISGSCASTQPNFDAAALTYELQARALTA